MWTFWGDRFGWGWDRERGLYLGLDAEWHKPLPDMTGPNPDFEAYEVLELKTLDLRLHFRSGGASAARDEVAQMYRMMGKELNGDDAVNFSSVMYVHDSHIDLNAYLSDEELGDLVKSLQVFGSLSGPRYYRGHFRDLILVGPLFHCLGVQPDEKDDFLAGRIPGAIKDVPTMGFVSGDSIPAESDERSLLAEMRDQF